MRTAVHGMARIGERRALKWALESYWAGRASADELDAVAAAVRRDNWNRLARAGVSFVPSNDFSLYDHVVDTALSVSAIPERFDTKALSLEPFNLDSGRSAKGNRFDLTRYFAMARGATEGGRAIAPLQMTKWFDTNYHHLVPEIGPATRFAPEPAKARGELTEAAELGISTTPVLVGPLTFLLRSAATEPGFQPLDLLDALVETYVELLAALARHGAAWVRLDEPALVEDRSTSELIALHRAYRRLGEAGTHPKIAVATYFGHVGAAMATLRDLPVDGIGLDLCAGPENAELLADVGGFGDKTLFAGVVDGRNVWANDLDNSLDVLDQLGGLCGELVVSTSCSLIHVPQSLAAESRIDPEISGWLAFGDEKLTELAVLARGAGESRAAVADALEKNREVLAARRHSPLVNDQAVQRASRAAPLDPRRPTQAPERAALQRTALGLPLLPVTTIGSFPQTPELRGVRASWRAGRTTDEDYEAALRREVDRVVELQEALGLDVVVHGEPERDDMVRYFATHLSGFALPEEGWVQSYGSRCVRPPILFGDVRRPAPITLGWARYAQARTQKPVKGMLTGPVTMLRWSFVRDDQPHAETAAQLGLAMRDELIDLQGHGITVVQIDEPGLGEGMPLRRSERPGYLAWATKAFRLASAAAASATQVHTHMCYADLADVLDALEDLDVDVVSFEAARSHVALIGDLADADYRGGAGPGVYDVHSPVVPTAAEIASLLRRAIDAVGAERLWVNPDCGLKTRRYDEASAALAHMVDGARSVRAELEDGALKAARVTKLSESPGTNGGGPRNGRMQ